MTDRIAPSSKALSEALVLSEEILRNIELSETSLTSIALKTGRLARLLNDVDMQMIMVYEAGGYPVEENGIPPEAWRLSEVAGRRFGIKDDKTGKTNYYAYTSSIGQLEDELRIAESSLAAARDPDVSVSSANPYQTVWSPVGNFLERKTIRESLMLSSARLASRRAMIHQYLVAKHYELKLSGIAEDIFARTRARVDMTIGSLVPDAVKRLSAVYENLQSDNPENWSNAVHSCRRLLEGLADAVFPATDEVRRKMVDGREIEIKLGKPNYINRILAFVEDRASSQRYAELVGSHISFLGDRLDAVFRAAQKGSHTTIVSQGEADRFVVYTYLLLGDVLSLT